MNIDPDLDLLISERLESKTSWAKDMEAAFELGRASALKELETKYHNEEI